MTPYEHRFIDASIIAAIDHWRATHRTTSFFYVARKIRSGEYRPQEFMFSITGTSNTKFMLFDTIGHCLIQCQCTTRAVRRIRENRVSIKIVSQRQLRYWARVAQSSIRSVTCDLLPGPRLGHEINSWGRSGTFLALRHPDSLQSCNSWRQVPLR